jgi:hypothetical protein
MITENVEDKGPSPKNDEMGAFAARTSQSIGDLF